MPGKMAQYRQRQRRIHLEWMQLLERRIAHLKELLPNYRGDPHYIQQEIPALEWAVRLMWEDIQRHAKQPSSNADEATDTIEVSP